MGNLTMSRLLAIGVLILSTQQAFAQVSVDGYSRRDGTYAQPHQRTRPDNSPLNNYSTKGNINPYTGQNGTVDPYRAPSPSIPTYDSTPSYSSPSTGSIGSYKGYGEQRDHLTNKKWRR